MKKPINRPAKDAGKPEQSRLSASAIPSDEQDGGAEQRAAFESAVACFHAGDFAQAKALFERAAQGSIREVAHTARLHARMCEQRLARAVPKLLTAEDHYNYAIALINERRLDLAEYHLHQALAQNPHGDHLYYALALARGLGGDIDAAYANLKHAIELQPRNRIVARNDPDFADIGQISPLSTLLRPEKPALSKSTSSGGE